MYYIAHLAQLSAIENIDVINSSDKIDIIKVVAIIIGFLVARVLTKQVMYILVGRFLERQGYSSKKELNKRKNTLVTAINTILTVLYVIVALVLVLSELGVNLPALITAFGALGVVAGIAGQSIIKDFLRGMSILFYDQMRVGDIVEIMDKGGIVENVSLQVTRLRDLDGNVHVIPNGEIKVVTNKTNTFANVNLDINLSYDSDIELVEKLANKIGQDMKLDDNWQERIIEPIAFLRISNFGDYSVNVKFLGQVQPGEQWQVAGEFRKRLKLAFDKNNIKIARTQVFLDKK